MELCIQIILHVILLHHRLPYLITLTLKKLYTLVMNTNYSKKHIVMCRRCNSFYVSNIQFLKLYHYHSQTNRILVLLQFNGYFRICFIWRIGIRNKNHVFCCIIFFQNDELSYLLSLIYIIFFDVFLFPFFFYLVISCDHLLAFFHLLDHLSLILIVFFLFPTTLRCVVQSF